MLSIRNLQVAYPIEGGFHLAVRDTSLEVAAGEFFTLLGPSGCGKTTTLRSVAGLETPTSGQIDIGGVGVFNGETGLVTPPQKRNISMVFQSYAVWPHMTVAQNVGFPLESMKMPKAQIRPKVLETLRMVGLDGYEDRPATQLSGGQQQRVALGRALVKGADLLLLDEPLSNLDAKLREQMRSELRSLQTTLGQTTIYVTHDQEEALSLSDRITLMDGGDLIETGTPLELYLRPRHIFTARFIGQAEFIPCSGLTRNGDSQQAETPFGPMLVSGNDRDEGNVLLVRPEHIQFADVSRGDAPNCFEGQVVSASFSGKHVEYVVAVADRQVAVQAASHTINKAGDKVRLHIPPELLVPLKDS